MLVLQLSGPHNAGRDGWEVAAQFLVRHGELSAPRREIRPGHCGRIHMSSHGASRVLVPPRPDKFRRREKPVRARLHSGFRWNRSMSGILRPASRPLSVMYAVAHTNPALQARCLTCARSGRARRSLRSLSRPQATIAVMCRRRNAPIIAPVTVGPGPANGQRLSRRRPPPLGRDALVARRSAPSTG